MVFTTTKNKHKTLSFKDAIFQCLPEDGGLYVPASLVDLRQFFLYMDQNTTYGDLVAAIVPTLFEGELNPISANRVAASAFHFEPVVKQLNNHLSVLELHHGPTGVFKDFGIAFLAAVMEEFLGENGYALTITATTGNTGSSVARAFQGRKGLTAVILYPRGTVKGLDPTTFVPNGGNILPIQIDGTFDDCQRLIRELFEDRPFINRYHVTSANTINVGRLLPQTFYFLYAFIKIKKFIRGDLLFSVPSGNFGNLLAGLYAWKFGLPVNGFIAATNANDAFGDFFKGKQFIPKAPIQTLSRSMDVANPSNYERLAAFYEEAPAVMRNMVYPKSINDAETREAIRKAWETYKIHLDPHGAVGLAAAEKLLEEDLEDGHVVVLSTGHPAKYADLLEELTGKRPVTPPHLQELEKESVPVSIIPPHIDALEAAIAGCC
ncbi:MAG: threonine synthase [Treponemataceae bacterium]|nr:threonine synthase [Treponemataceae bacterium]